MAIRDLITFGLITSAIYAGWLAFNGRIAAASESDNFFGGGSAVDRFQALGDLSFPVDPFFAGKQASPPDAEPRNRFFDDVFGFDLFGSRTRAAPVFTTSVSPAPSDDVDTVARTIWGEARGDGAPGMRAVAAVIMNRVADSRWPSSPAAVATQSSQFSTWNVGDPNRAKALSVTQDDPQFALALDIAADAVARRLRDTTGGADHFYAQSILPPFWALGARVTARIGGHTFLTGVA